MTLGSQLTHTFPPSQAHSQLLATALQRREDPMDTHLACKWEPGWPSPHTEPLAHTLSLSLLSRTRELLQACQRLCPVRRQEASKRSKEPGLLACLLLGFFYQFPREINSLHMTDSFSKYTANSNHRAPPAIAPPADRNNHDQTPKQQPSSMLRIRSWRKGNAKTQRCSWTCSLLLSPLPTNQPSSTATLFCNLLSA